ncbi:complement component C8 beta chain [Tachyglossus aculeatus]|uniref:complement component C8 beta chain n=1 Tax=Tachyglossus aculeatus TaxID=9261 RepID=UPI0018F486B7|nr:complement component C8 beta chain [Tachyglossus aculeatus]
MLPPLGPMGPLLLGLVLACLLPPFSRPGSTNRTEPAPEAGSRRLGPARRPRSVQGPPEPIDCQLSDWSPWTTCDPCQKLRYRSARVLRPSQFNGQPCQDPDSEAETCTAPGPCPKLRPCEGFVCEETGRCVNRRLRCNGDDDCGDGSDERACSKVYRKCSPDLEQYWAIDRLASGLNLFTNQLEGPVLDHVHFAGACAPNYILDRRFRKPYNVEGYEPQTKGKYEFVLKEYNSFSSFEQDTLRYRSVQSSFGLGFKVSGVFEIGFNLNSNDVRTYISRTKRFSGSESQFLHARSELSVARYKLKSRGLVLHPDFLRRVRSLPLPYTYGTYRDLFRDFGTHFVTEATLGGVYEYTLVMNRRALEEKGFSLSDVQSCMQKGFKVGAAIKGVYVSVGASGERCQAILREIGENKSERKFVQDFVVLVRGGGSEHITALAHKDLPTADLMQEWGDTVQYNPEIIQLKAEPLYELVTAADFASAITLRQNMKRALDEFHEETSPCRCAPCQGNGIPILRETRCECLCPAGFCGSACEISRRQAPLVDGQWSCWSSWSECSGGQRRRSRTCSHPTPQAGGGDCLGPSDQMDRC